MRQLVKMVHWRQPLDMGWLKSPAGAVLIMWLLLMIFIPIANWTAGITFVRRLIVASVLLQSVVVFLILLPAWGWQRTVSTFLLIAFLTLLIEIIGSHSGWLFGSYHYTDHLQPQLGGVPLLIPLAWFMMLPPAWAVADRFRGKRWQFILVAGLAMTSWDLFLDPQMVGWELWVWDQPGGYFGIPWHNYFGWLATAMLLTWILKPAPLPVTPLIFVFALSWFLETFGLLFFWQLPGPALVGGLIMGAILLMAVRSSSGYSNSSFSRDVTHST